MIINRKVSDPTEDVDDVDGDADRWRVKDLFSSHQLRTSPQSESGRP